MEKDYLNDDLDSDNESTQKKKNSAGSKRKIGRPSRKSRLTIKRHNWIRDKYYALKKNRHANTLDEMAGLILSEMLENAPPCFEKLIYEKSTILKVLKSRAWEKK